MFSFYFYLLLVSVCSGYKILISTPNAVKSESTTVFEIACGLAEAGHEVTYITAFKGPRTHKNLNVVWVQEVQKASDEMLEEEGSLIVSVSRLYEIMGIFFKIQNQITWDDKRVKEIWNKRKEYKLLVTLSYYSEGSFAFLIDNPIPLVILGTPGAESFTLSRAGNWLTPAIMPSILISLDENMNFWERSSNMFSTLHFYHLHHRAVKEYITPVQERFPSYGDYNKYYERVALTLLNGNFAMDNPVPLLPSQIEIGTITIQKPEPLPKDVETFIESSGEAGVIYFSLGTIAKSSDLSPEVKKILLEAFKRVPQKVLWKYEAPDLQIPSNVMIKKWMPQQDILRHPRTRVFISHCGNLGTQEAKYYGVPILGMPVTFDQPRNAARLERKGYAISLQWEHLTTDKLVETLNALVNDTSYRERLKTMSVVLQDQQETPLEKAIWWLEYVVRHKGAPHLEYAGKRLSLFQYLMLDVILFWLGLLSVIVLSAVCAVRAICCPKKRHSANAHATSQKKDNKKKQ